MSGESKHQTTGHGSAGWIAFWNNDSPIYVCNRHKQVHYETIARDMVALLPASRPNRVLDFGCGEALSAGIVARRCRELVLCDAAPATRARLMRRFADDKGIAIASPGDLACERDGTFDVIVANSVVQYLKADQLPAQLGQWRRLLAPGGRLILGDIIPKQSGIAADAGALLRFAWHNGFFLAAVAGLVKTLFSDYRT